MTSTSNPKISLLLPVFNGQQYLYQCMNSIFAQSMNEFELIIGNNCSTDQSDEIIKKFSDPRIKYIPHVKNKGLFKNLNFMIERSCAPLIHFICQDDLLVNNCLETEIDFFARHPEIDIAFCKSQSINEEGIVINQGVLGDLPEVIDTSLILQLFFYYGCIPGNLSTVCLRRQCFAEFGLFNDFFQVSGDYEMWVRICQKKAMGVIHQHLINIRSHEKQLSRTSESGVRCILENREIRSKILALLPGEIRFWAKFYSQMRQNVLDVHYSIHCLRYQKYSNFIRILHILSLKEFSIGLLFWLLTLNNQLYKPQPKWVKYV
ncbi:MAG: glycosyltransferase [Goleter apudmare HA4340-LM2]|nr:glycosyltransferase [Goleter apudmare HA4340-LM2]